jgi:pyruvate dehydrogenase E1 component alpha subunit
MEPDISRGELQRLYKLMVLVRALDIRGLQLQRQGRIGFFIGSLGQKKFRVASSL